LSSRSSYQQVTESRRFLRPRTRDKEEQEARGQENEEEALNQRLAGGRRAQVQAEQNPEQPITIRQKVNRFLAQTRLSSTAQLSLLKYWFNKRDEEPEIYRISQVVYGGAFSQVKVERDFSGFALVLTNLRTLLADYTLNAILVIKNNLDLPNRFKF